MISYRAISLYACIVLATLVLVTFMPAVGNDFVDWDDYSFVTTNHHIQSITLDSLRWMLTTFYQGAWHPLTWFSHALDRSLWGLNPAPHRLINIILHTLNVLLFCALCIRLQDAWVERNPQRETVTPESKFVAAWTAAMSSDSTICRSNGSARFSLRVRTARHNSSTARPCAHACSNSATNKSAAPGACNRLNATIDTSRTQ